MTSIAYAKQIPLIDRNSFLDTNSMAIDVSNNLKGHYRDRKIHLPFHSASKIAYSASLNQIGKTDSSRLTEGLIDASPDNGNGPSFLFINHRTKNKMHEGSTSCRGDLSNQKLNLSCLSVNQKICEVAYNYISKLEREGKDLIALSEAAKSCESMERGVFSDLQNLMTEDSYYNSLAQEREAVEEHYKKMMNDKEFVNDGARFFPGVGEVKSQIIGKNKVKEIVSFGRGGQVSNEGFNEKFSLYLETLDICRHAFPPGRTSQFWRPLFEDLPKVKNTSNSTSPRPRDRRTQ